MGRIRIAIATETTIGGVKNQVLYLLKYLNRTEFEPTVIFPDKPRGDHIEEHDFETQLEELQVQHFKIPMVRHISPLQDGKGFFALKQILTSERFDAVHAHASKAGFLARLAAHWNNVHPVFYSPHVFAFQRHNSAIYRTLEQTASRWTDAFLVCSESEKLAAMNAGIGSENSIHVIRDATVYPVYPSRSRDSIRQELGCSGDQIIFLTLTRLVPYKGVDFLIRAFSKLATARKDVILWIAGEGEQRADLESLATSCGISDRVRFTGFRNDPVDLLNASDCFVLTSRVEGAPNAILEALAMEKPLIASRVPGTDELLKDSEHWRLVTWNDPDSIAKGLSAYAEQRFPGAPVRDLSREWFDVPGQVEKIADIYRRYNRRNRGGTFEQPVEVG